MKANIFFFVTTICVVVVSLFLIIFLAYLARFLNTCRKIAEILKDKTADLGEEAEEFLSRVQDSFIFRLFFPSNKSKMKKKRKKS